MGDGVVGLGRGRLTVNGWSESGSSWSGSPVDVRFFFRQQHQGSDLVALSQAPDAKKVVSHR